MIRYMIGTQPPLSDHFYSFYEFTLNMFLFFPDLREWIRFPLLSNLIVYKCYIIYNIWYKVNDCVFIPDIISSSILDFCLICFRIIYCFISASYFVFLALFNSLHLNLRNSFILCFNISHNLISDLLEFLIVLFFVFPVSVLLINVYFFLSIPAPHFHIAPVRNVF